MAIIDWLGKNPIFIVVAGIASIIALIGWLLTLRRSKLLVSWAQFQYIQGHTNSLNKLKVCYDNIDIITLTITKIAIWNKFGTLKKTDVAPADPIRLFASGKSRLLDASIVAVSKKSNSIELRRDATDNSLILEFDFLEAHEGAVIQVLHTEADKICISGKIIGGKSIKCTIEPELRDNKKKVRGFSIVLISSLVFLLLTLSYVVVLIISLQSDLNQCTARLNNLAVNETQVSPDVRNLMYSLTYKNIVDSRKYLVMCITYSVLDVLAILIITSLFVNKTPRALRIYNDFDNIRS